MPLTISGLVAYPSEPREIGQTILRSLERLHNEAKFKQLHSWEETDIPGRFIATEVLKLIENGTIFIADITRLNFNVVFEIAYGTVDVATGYAGNEPHQAIQAGHEVNIILMADYGTNMYGDVLFATEDTINKKPELVEHFLRATLKGWQYAIENQEEAVGIILKYATDKTKAIRAICSRGLFH